MIIQELQDQTASIFREYFGRTPLTQRLEDVYGEATELRRYLDMQNIKEETGDLLCSVLALCAECGLDAEELIQATHEKIKARAVQYKSLGRKVQVALLGGAFDPPTLGHLAVAQFVIESSKTFDEVWLLPCYQHMYNKDLAEPFHRLAMCEELAKSDGRVKVLGYEIQNKLRGETYNLVKQLLETKFNGETNFSMIIGMDNANTFDKWVNYQELERMIRFVVVPRVGEERDESVDWYLKPPHIYLYPDKPLPETSSTQLREDMRHYWSDECRFAGFQKDKILRLTTERVFEYMKDKKLYAG